MNIPIRWSDNTADLKKNLAQGLDQIEATKAAADRLVRTLGGDTLITAAHKYAAAVEQLGGAAKLTVAKQAQVNAVMVKAVEALNASGKGASEVAKHFQTLADATAKVKTPLEQVATASKGAKVSLDALAGKLIASMGSGLDKQAEAAKNLGTAAAGAKKPIDAMAASMAKANENATASQKMVAGMGAGKAAIEQTAVATKKLADAATKAKPPLDALAGKLIGSMGGSVDKQTAATKAFGDAATKAKQPIDAMAASMAKASTNAQASQKMLAGMGAGKAALDQAATAAKGLADAAARAKPALDALAGKLIGSMGGSVDKQAAAVKALATEAAHAKAPLDAMAASMAKGSTNAIASAKAIAGMSAIGSKTFKDLEKESKDAAKAMGVLGDKLSAFGTGAKAVGGTLIAGLTVPLVALGTVSTKAAMDFDTSFANVRRTVDGVVAAGGGLTLFGKNLAQDLRNLAKEMPITVGELNRIAAAAGQLGIAAPDIMLFTKTMAILGTTTNLTSDAAAVGIAHIQNQFQAAGKDTDRFAAALVGLGTSSAASESQILEFATRMAGAGKIAGMTQPQILGIATALADVGIEAEAGGTAFQKVVLAMVSATVTGGEKLEEFARVAGITGDKFKELFASGNAAEAFKLWVEGLQTAGTGAIKIFQDLGLEDQRLVRSFLSLSAAGEKLNGFLVNGTKFWDENTAHLTAAAQKWQAFSQQLFIFKNRLEDVAITFGDVMLRIGRTLLDVLDPFIQDLAALAQAFATLPVPVQNATIGIGTFVAGLPVAIYLAGGLAGAAGNLVKAMDTLGIASKAATIGFVQAAGWWIGIPVAIGLTVTAIKELTGSWTTAFTIMMPPVGFLMKAWQDLNKVLADHPKETAAVKASYEALAHTLDNAVTIAFDDLKTALMGVKDTLWATNPFLDALITKLGRLAQRGWPDFRQALLNLSPTLGAIVLKLEQASNVDYEKIARGLTAIDRITQREADRRAGRISGTRDLSFQGGLPLLPTGTFIDGRAALRAYRAEQDGLGTSTKGLQEKIDALTESQKARIRELKETNKFSNAAIAADKEVQVSTEIVATYLRQIKGNTAETARADASNRRYAESWETLNNLSRVAADVTGEVSEKTRGLILYYHNLKAPLEDIVNARIAEEGVVRAVIEANDAFQKSQKEYIEAWQELNDVTRVSSDLSGEVSEQTRGLILYYHEHNISIEKMVKARIAEEGVIRAVIEAYDDLEDQKKRVRKLEEDDRTFKANELPGFVPQATFDNLSKAIEAYQDYQEKRLGLTKKGLKDELAEIERARARAKADPKLESIRLIDPVLWQRGQDAADRFFDTLVDQATKAHAAMEMRPLFEATLAIADAFSKLGQAAGGAFGTAIVGASELIRLLANMNKLRWEAANLPDPTGQRKIDAQNAKSALIWGAIGLGFQIAADSINTQGTPITSSLMVRSGNLNYKPGTNVGASTKSLVAQGALSGAAAGAPLAPITFGLSVPVGAGIGALAGWIRSGKEWRQLVNDIGREYGGLHVPEDFAKAIEDIEKTTGMKSAAAIATQLDQLIDQVGGLNAANFDMFTAKLRDIFVFVGRGEMSLANATEVLDKNFQEFAEAGTDSMGYLADSLKEIIRLNDTIGTQSKAIAEYLKGQGAKAVGASNAILLSLTPQLTKWQELAERIAVARKGGADKGLVTDEEGKTRAMTKAERDAFNKDLAEQKTLAAQNSHELKNMGIIALATFAAAVASGATFNEALAAAAPGLKALRDSYEALGITTDNVALKALLLQSAMLEKNPELIAGIGGLADGFAALSNMGLLNVETFNAMTETGQSMYEKLLTAAQDLGGGEREALLQMQDYLHSAEKAAKELGIPLDENTQKLIDQSKELGIWKTKGKSATDALTEGMETLVKKVEKLINTLLGIPDVDYTVTQHNEVENPPDEPPPPGPGGRPPPEEQYRPDQPFYAARGVSAFHDVFRPLGTDSIPAMLTPRELVINEAQTGRLGAALTHGLNLLRLDAATTTTQGAGGGGTSGVGPVLGPIEIVLEVDGQRLGKTVFDPRNLSGVTRQRFRAAVHEVGSEVPR